MLLSGTYKIHAPAKATARHCLHRRRELQVSCRHTRVSFPQNRACRGRYSNLTTYLKNKKKAGSSVARRNRWHDAPRSPLASPRPTIYEPKVSALRALVLPTNPSDAQRQYKDIRSTSKNLAANQMASISYFCRKQRCLFSPQDALPRSRLGGTVQSQIPRDSSREQNLRQQNRTEHVSTALWINR